MGCPVLRGGGLAVPPLSLSLHPSPPSPSPSLSRTLLSHLHPSQIDVLTRIYPCGECASHFAALVRAAPPDTTSGPALRAWTCEAHNAVNASLGKPAFNCRLVGARWAPLDCEEDGAEVGCALK